MMRMESLVGVLLVLQLAAFGWRINREIPVGDEGRRTWLPIPDYVNLLSFLLAVALCVVRPLVADDFDRVSKTMLGIGYILMGLHPINVANHYRLLFSRRGRSIYLNGPRGDYPLVTDHEALSLIVSAIVTALGGWCVYNAR